MKDIQSARIRITVYMIVIGCCWLVTKIAPDTGIAVFLWGVIFFSFGAIFWATLTLITDGIVLLSKNADDQTALLEQQNNINTAQLQLLAGMADKLGMPVNDINEVVTEFGIEYE